MPGIKLEFKPRTTNKVADRIGRCRINVLANYELSVFGQPMGFVSDVLMEDKPP